MHNLPPQAIIAAKAMSGKFMDCATEITIGIINAALAVFDVNSVRKIINAVITETKYPKRFGLYKLNDAIRHNLTGTRIFHHNTKCQTTTRIKRARPIQHVLGFLSVATPEIQIKITT